VLLSSQTFTIYREASLCFQWQRLPSNHTNVFKLKVFCEKRSQLIFLAYAFATNGKSKCSIFTDLTRDDSDLTNNRKQHHCKSQTRFLIINIQHACSDILHRGGVERRAFTNTTLTVCQFIALLWLSCFVLFFFFCTTYASNEIS